MITKTTSITYFGDNGKIIKTKNSIIIDKPEIVLQFHIMDENIVLSLEVNITLSFPQLKQNLSQKLDLPIDSICIYYKDRIPTKELYNYLLLDGNDRIEVYLVAHSKFERKKIKNSLRKIMEKKMKIIPLL